LTTFWVHTPAEALPLVEAASCDAQRRPEERSVASQNKVALITESGASESGRGPETAV